MKPIIKKIGDSFRFHLALTNFNLGNSLSKPTKTATTSSSHLKRSLWMSNQIYPLVVLKKHIFSVDSTDSEYRLKSQTFTSLSNIHAWKDLFFWYPRIHIPKENTCVLIVFNCEEDHFMLRKFLNELMTKTFNTCVYIIITD